MKRKYFFVTCFHVLSEIIANKKGDIELFYGKKDKEKKIKIKLDKNQRLIKFFYKPIDAILVEILGSDNINEDKFLYPDLNYKNGYNFYEDKNFYLAGYPQNNPNQKERSISSGKIAIINNPDSEFEHSLDTGPGSSGSPICLSDNLCVIGIHKEGNRFRPVNYGTFLGYILDNLKNDKEEEKEENDEEENKKKEEEEHNHKKFKCGWIQKYTGQLKNALRHGHGTGYYSNGNIYEGEWVKDKKHGKGKYTFYNGDIYIGEFKNDKIDGEGVFYINHYPKNGDKFEGFLQLGIPEYFDVYNSFLA